MGWWWHGNGVAQCMGCWGWGPGGVWGGDRVCRTMGRGHKGLWGRGMWESGDGARGTLGTGHKRPRGQGAWDHGAQNNRGHTGPWGQSEGRGARGALRPAGTVPGARGTGGYGNRAHGTMGTGHRGHTAGTLQVEATGSGGRGARPAFRHRHRAASGLIPGAGPVPTPYKCHQRRVTTQRTPLPGRFSEDDTFAGSAMSHASPAAPRSGAGSPRRSRDHAQCREPPRGVTLLGTSGDSGPVEAVIDPDMENLFNEFLGKVRPKEEEGTVTISSTVVPAGAQPYHYALRDTEHKALCLQGGRLVALSLQGANDAQEEAISVVPNRHLERRRCPLIVGIRGGSQALSCGTGPEPQLKLEDMGVLELFRGEDHAVPYTFYKTFGGSTHTFEAAAFPGHFLSTTPRPGEELGLAPPDAPDAITSFYLRRK
uniref:Interleukin-1 receptor antagonist protein n=1 Tax=Anas platyrhynchos TaxID=8839 RepID=A0A8B9R5K2_ANAPL